MNATETLADCVSFIVLLRTVLLALWKGERESQCNKVFEMARVFMTGIRTVVVRMAE